MLRVGDIYLQIRLYVYRLRLLHFEWKICRNTNSLIYIFIENQGKT